MKNTKKIRVIQIIIMIIALMMTLGTSVFARYDDDIADRDSKLSSTTVPGKIATNNFKPGELTRDDYDVAFNMASTIVGALTTVGIVVAVVGIIILGLKYMMGSVEQKADYKKTMIPYLVGCILIFCISTIVSIIYNLVSQL